MAILKWAGSKYQLLDHIYGYLPSEFENMHYIEPFMGSASVFLNLKRSPAKTTLIDINPHIVQLFTFLKNEAMSENQNGLYLMNEILKAYDAHTHHSYAHAKAFYYKLRDEFNDRTLSPPAHLAAFIFMNRLGYNGLYRENKQGRYNIPIGEVQYRTHKIPSYDELLKTGNQLKNVTISQENWLLDINQTAANNCFIYSDSPYDEIKKNSFTSYSQTQFKREEQVTLYQKLFKFHQNGGKFLHSNSDTPFIRDLYKNFSIECVQVKRKIASSSSDRRLVSELLISNI